jgi:hypothetical protein
MVNRNVPDEPRDSDPFYRDLLSGLSPQSKELRVVSGRDT